MNDRDIKLAHKYTKVQLEILHSTVTIVLKMCLMLQSAGVDIDDLFTELSQKRGPHES